MVTGPDDTGAVMTDATHRLMATYAPPPVTFVRGQGSRAVGRRRAPVPRLPVGPGRHVARPRPPGGGRRHLRPGPAPCCTSPTCSAPSPSAEVAATLDRLLGGGPGQVFFCNSGRRGQRVRHQAGPPVGRPGQVRRRQRLRLVPRPHPGHPARHRPAGQARAVPAAARGLPPRGLAAISMPWPRPSTRRWPPCCSSRSRARAASTRAAPTTSRRSGGSATSAACC